MRKHNEGYALVLVLVVLIVVCLVATGLMTYSLSNLENQRRAVALMEEEYEAAGKIERYTAKLENMILQTEPDGEVLEGSNWTISLTDDKFRKLAGEVELNLPEEGDSIFVVAQVGTTKITCEIGFAATGVIRSPGSYSLTDCTGIMCRSYEISRGVAQE